MNSPKSRIHFGRILRVLLETKLTWAQDPEMNKLGESGLRTPATKKRMREEQKQRTKEIKDLEEKAASLAAERSTLLQNGGSGSDLDEEIAKLKSELEIKSEAKPVTGIKRVKDEADEEEFEKKKPAKKKRATGVKKEESDDEEAVKPVKKSRGKKAAKAVKQEDEGVRVHLYFHHSYKLPAGAEDRIITDFWYRRWASSARRRRSPFQPQRKPVERKLQSPSRRKMR